MRIKLNLNKTIEILERAKTSIIELTDSQKQKDHPYYPNYLVREIKRLNKLIEKSENKKL